MLLSNIGTFYNPQTGEGTIGRNYAYQRPTNVIGFFDDKNFNSYVAGGGTATQELKSRLDKPRQDRKRPRWVIVDKLLNKS